MHNLFSEFLDISSVDSYFENCEKYAKSDESKEFVIALEQCEEYLKNPKVNAHML